MGLSPTKEAKVDKPHLTYYTSYMSKIFAIGDVHGCYKTLMALMKKLPIDKSKDVVVFVGDYIDRGSGTKKVVDQMIKWEKKYPHWKFLFGNHESLMLDALIGGGQIYHSYDLWWMQGGRETFESYIPSERTVYEKSITQVKDVIPFEHLEWLRTRPYYYDSDKYFFVHGAVVPDMSLEDLKKGLDEGKSDLQYAVIWGRDLFINSKQNWGKKIIFGHTADSDGRYYSSESPWGKNQKFMPIVKKNKIGIDCAVCPSACNKLCAVELPAEKFYFQEYMD